MSNTKSLLTLVTGLALGATLGILLAPASGKETRRKLMKRGETLGDDVNDLMEEGKSAMEEVKDKAASTASNMADKARDTASQVKDDVKQAGQTAARHAGASNN